MCLFAQGVRVGCFEPYSCHRALCFLLLQTKMPPLVFLFGTWRLPLCEAPLPLLHLLEIPSLFPAGSIAHGFGGAGTGPLFEGFQKGACKLGLIPAFTRMLLPSSYLHSPMFFLQKPSKSSKGADKFDGEDFTRMFPGGAAGMSAMMAGRNAGKGGLGGGTSDSMHHAAMQVRTASRHERKWATCFYCAVCV